LLWSVTPPPTFFPSAREDLAKPLALGCRRFLPRRVADSCEDSPSLKSIRWFCEMLSMKNSVFPFFSPGFFSFLPIWNLLTARVDLGSFPHSPSRPPPRKNITVKKFFLSWFSMLSCRVDLTAGFGLVKGGPFCPKSVLRMISPCLFPGSFRILLDHHMDAGDARSNLDRY